MSCLLTHGLKAFSLCLFCISVLSAQDQWQIVREPDWTFPMGRLLFWNENRGVIKGNYDLLRTDNGGDIWQNTQWPDSVWNPQDPWNMLLTGSWLDMEFGERQDVWLVGSEGYLLHIPANGDVMRFITIPDRPLLRAGWFKVKSRMWLEGYYGEVFYSNDGGKSFEERYDFNNLLWDIAFTDSLDGFVLARTGQDSSRCYRTRDGGFSWAPILAPEVHGRKMFFFDEKNGWVVGEFNEIFKTDDGGETWQRIWALDKRYRLFSIFFVNENVGWLCGADGLLLRSDDGGETWQRAASPAMNDVYDVFFVNENTGWAGCDWGLIARTDDGGESWRWQVETPSNHLFGVHFLDDEKGFAVGWKTAVVTTDAGQNWTVIDSLQGHDVQFVDAQTGWVSGNLNGKRWLYKTTDGGDQWDKAYNFGQDVINDFIFSDRDHGWVISATEKLSKLFATMNGGLTWEMLAEFPFALYDIDFVSTSTGWLSGSGGRIFRTDDGGKTWIKQREVEETLTTNLLDIDFVDEQYGWATGFLGLILATTDGGQTWIEQNRTIWIDDQFNAVQFLNRKEGWVVGLIGTILHTTDGGQTWDDSFSEYMGYWWADVYFSDPNHGWTVGLYGAVNRYINTSDVVAEAGDGLPSLPGELSVTPNPMQRSTSIIYTVPFSANVKISIYNVLGRKIRTLVSQSMNDGRYSIPWNGQNGDGVDVANGTYFSCLRVEGRPPVVQRIIVVR